MSTTIERYIHLPTADATERLRADEPLGAGVLQTLASNGTVLCREGSLRTLWESPGTEVWSAIPGDDPALFPWDDTASDGVFVAFAGRFRVRLYGETSTPPKLILHARGRAPTGDELGVVLWQMPAPGYPSDAVGAFAEARTSSTTIDDVVASLDLDLSKLGAFAVEPVDERGALIEVAVYVGAWCTSDDTAAKALLSSAVLYLDKPS